MQDKENSNAFAEAFCHAVLVEHRNEIANILQQIEKENALRDCTRKAISGLYLKP